MQRKVRLCNAILAGIGMIVLILDAKTAFSGAAEGIRLCIGTVIPSLFPFFVLSIMLTSALQGVSLPLLGPVCRLLKIPKNCGGLLLLSFLGGYPTGAQSIGLAARSGDVGKQEARRMLAFCNNAGPAFLFGMGAVLFERVWICVVIWLIHILSACIVGMWTPGMSDASKVTTEARNISWTDGLKQAVITLALVCGWVILFRVIWAVVDRWCLWLLPEKSKLLFSGFLELSNGCCNLAEVGTVGFRFLLFGVWISFGGICVTMQTFSVLRDSGIDTGLYLPGKLTQAAVCILLSSAAQWLFDREQRFLPPVSCLLICVLVCVWFHFYTRKPKFSVAFPKRMVYNEEKHT